MSADAGPAGPIQPDALKGDAPWPWSPGAGKDVWAMFLACVAGDLEAVRRLLARDPSLVRAHYEYRTPLSFAVRENQLRVFPSEPRESYDDAIEIQSIYTHSQRFSTSLGFEIATRDNINLLGHIPLGPPLSVSDVEVEQEVGRPFAYVGRMVFGDEGSKGTDIIDLSDPANPKVIYRWRIEEEDLHLPLGGMDVKYFKYNNRYYVVQSLQFFGGGPDSVRGYKESYLGPRDSFGNPYGGNVLVASRTSSETSVAASGRAPGVAILSPCIVRAAAPMTPRSSTRVSPRRVPPGSRTATTVGAVPPPPRPRPARATIHSESIRSCVVFPQPSGPSNTRSGITPA